MSKDMVNHPDHYKHDGIETIDVIRAWTKGLDGIKATDTGNVIKYISRWNDKNGLEDLKKAQWYLNHLIAEVEGTAKVSEDIDDEPLVLKAVRKYYDRMYCNGETNIVGLFKDPKTQTEDTYVIGIEDTDAGTYVYAEVPCKDLHERKSFIFDNESVQKDLEKLLKKED